MGQLHNLSSGRTVYYTDSGTGPVLLCLHGLGGASYFFSSLAGSLADSFRTVAVDLPGCGFSPSSISGFSFEDCAAVVGQLIEERLGGPVSILGHSMGAIVALMLAARRPGAVAGMIFVGGLAEPIPEARKRLAERSREVRERGMSGVGDLAMPIVFSKASLRRMPDKVAMYNRLLELNDPVKYAEAAEALSQASASEFVSKVSVPSLAITGTEDHYAPPSYVQELAKHLPGPVQYCELEECGHMPFFERPEVFERVIREFLSR